LKKSKTKIKSKTKPKSKAKTPARSPRISAKTVDAYLARVPEPSRALLQKIRAAIRSVLPPQASEVISYGIPAFRHRRTLVWFAAFSDHCSLFPGASVIAAFQSELRAFTTSKGTIQFTTAKPLPIPLVKKLVKARLAELP